MTEPVNFDTKNLFIDTSCFEDQCFNFDNSIFTELKHLSNENKVNLVIFDITIAEVKNRQDLRT
jgi:hypothetical protein